MEVFGEGWLDQKERNKTHARCRKWIIRVRTECGVKSKYFVGTYRDAIEAKRRFCEDLWNDSPSSYLTFEEYANKWLDLRKSDPELSPNTLSRDIRVVKTLIYWFGDKKLTDLNPMVIKEVMPRFKSVTGAELSGTSKNMHFSELSTILKTAVDDGLIDKNPMDKVKIPKRDTKEKRCLTKDEIDKLIECLDKEEMDGRIFCMYFMIYLALRLQEAIAVKWKDIDFENKKVYIRRAYKQADGTVGPPKSKAGIRKLPIPTTFFEKLVKWYDKHEEKHSDVEWVCPTTLNAIMTPTAMRKWYGRFRQKYNLRHVSFHELRHSNLTYASHRMTEFDLQKYAGWSSMQPVRIYIHFDDESLTNSLEDMF